MLCFSCLCFQSNVFVYKMGTQLKSSPAPLLGGELAMSITVNAADNSSASSSTSSLTTSSSNSKQDPSDSLTVDPPVAAKKKRSSKKRPAETTSRSLHVSSVVLF